MSMNFHSFLDSARLVGPVSGARRSPLGGMAKRVFDVLLALLILPVVGLVLIGVAIMIKMQDRGTILYGHTRIGFDGRTFRCWKFRTMVEDGDQVLEQHLNSHPAEREVWLRERKLDNDPRVTPLGAVLRRLSLDELPQLINVLNGEMSLIGPRPVVLDELAHYAGSTDYYLRVRPGVTGLWQVSGRSDTSYRERVSLDRYYVSNWSVLLDFWILLRTVPAVLSSRGAR